MKKLTVRNRKQTKEVKSNKGKNSRYASKIQLQKRGIFSGNSPFRLTEGAGIPLSEFNRIRFINK